MKFKLVETLDCEDVHYWHIVPDNNLVGGIHAWVVCTGHKTISRVEASE